MNGSRRTSTYCGHDDDQKLLTLELLHRAHLDVRQACPAQQQSDLLALGANSDAKTLIVAVLPFSKEKNKSGFPVHYDVTAWFHLLLVGGDDADVRNADRFVQLLGQLAAVEHDLNCLGCVKP